MSIRDSLRGMKLVDIGRGLAPAVVARFLAGLGAEVVRLEPASGDPFHAVYPGYASLHAGASIERIERPDDPRAAELIAGADILLTGGEDFPDYAWSLDPDVVAARHPGLFVLDIAAYPEGASGAAVDHLVQARSGICYEQYTDRPIRTGFESASYGAALQGLLGLLGAIRSGRGQIVRTSFYEGALTWGLPFWSKASDPDPGFPRVLPKDPVPLIFRCKDGRYLHFVMGSAGAKYKVYRCLGIDDPTVKETDSGQPTGTGDPRKMFGDIDLLAAHAEKIDSADLLASLQREGVAVELVNDPGGCWDDPQVVFSGLIEADAEGRRSVGLPITGTIGESPRTPAEPVGNAPLAGVRVLDFGLFVAGPFGPMCLADLGADVIKVEPLTGDANRMIFKSFASANRGKRSIAIDMKSPEGRDVVQRLCDSADVIGSNFRPGVSARLGIDPAAIHARDPDKIVLEVTGYGREGPKGGLAGWDMVFQAFCGLEARSAGTGNVPLWNRSSMVDYVTGMMGAIAVTAALCARRRGGGGADLQANLLGSGLFLLSEIVQEADGSFAGASPLNHAQTGFHPAEAMYQASDGWIAISARTDAVAQRLAALLGLRLGPRAGWGEKEEWVIAAALRERSAGEWLEALSDAGIWAEPCVRDGEDYLDDGARHPRTSVVEYTDHVHGRVRQPGALFRLSRDPVGARPMLPRLGEHTREILRELGYEPGRIEELHGMGAVA